MYSCICLALCIRCPHFRWNRCLAAVMVMSCRWAEYWTFGAQDPWCTECTPGPEARAEPNHSCCHKDQVDYFFEISLQTARGPAVRQTSSLRQDPAPPCARPGGFARKFARDVLGPYKTASVRACSLPLMFGLLPNMGRSTCV